jgi:hypothetical protein
MREISRRVPTIVSTERWNFSAPSADNDEFSALLAEKNRLIFFQKYATMRLAIRLCDVDTICICARQIKCNKFITFDDVADTF